MLATASLFGAGPPPVLSALAPTSIFGKGLGYFFVECHIDYFISWPLLVFSAFAPAVSFFGSGLRMFSRHRPPRGSRPSCWIRFQADLFFSALPHASFIGRGLLGLGRKLVLSAVASWPQLVFSAAASLPVFSAFAFPHVLIVFLAACFVGFPVVGTPLTKMLMLVSVT